MRENGKTYNRFITGLKAMIEHLEFLEDEVRRCYHDMEEYEAKIDLLETQSRICDRLHLSGDRRESGGQKREM